MDGMATGDEKNDRIIRLITDQLGVSEDKVRTHLADNGSLSLGADSLDVVELVMELEDELSDDSGEQP